jgi:TfoX/Sxy family transcriptional regulator of competence genes
VAEPYLTELTSIVTRSLATSELAAAISYKHFFSGAAAYVDGRLFMTLTPAGLALKVSEDHRQMLFAEGAMPLKYFATGPVKENYALVPDARLNDSDFLREWISSSIDYVRSGTRAQH